MFCKITDKEGSGLGRRWMGGAEAGSVSRTLGMRRTRWPLQHSRRSFASLQGARPRRDSLHLIIEGSGHELDEPCDQSPPLGDIDMLPFTADSVVDLPCRFSDRCHPE